METPTTDILIVNHGTIVQLVPLTPDGRAFLEGEVCADPWQWQSGGLCAEPRSIAAIVREATDEGLVLQ